ncbi:hypothetical protein Tco_1366500, partial [Tanacetum coccineum]
KTNEVNTQKPKTVYESVNRDKVIIEDWNSDDEDDVSKVQTVSPVKTNETQIVKTRVDKIGLITPVKQNEKRAVHKVSTARPVSNARPVSTVRPFAPKIAQTSGVIRPIYPRMDNVRPRGSYSPIKRSYYTKPAFRPKDIKQDVKTFGVQNMTTAGTRAIVNTGKGKMDTDLKKSRWVWRPKGNYLDHVSKDSGLFMLKKGNPEILLQDHAVVDSGCSSHMTGNKAYLSDYEDYNGGFMAFGSDPKGGKIKDKSFSGNVTPLLPSMLAQPTEAEGAVSERPSKTQPTPSPPHQSVDQHETQPDPSPRPSPTITIPDSIPMGFGGNQGDQVFDDVDVNDAIDYMETDAYMQKGVSIEDQVSTVKPDESTNKPEASTAKPKEVEVSTDKLDEALVRFLPYISLG